MGIFSWKEYFISPTIGKNNRIYSASESRFVYALNYDGSLAWKVGVEEDVTWPSPALSSDGHFTLVEWVMVFLMVSFLQFKTESTGIEQTYWPKIHNDNQNTGIH